MLRVTGVEHTRCSASARSSLASAADIPVANLLETAGLDEALAFHILDLTIVRAGDACGGDYGADPTTLFEITLEVGCVFGGDVKCILSFAFADCLAGPQRSTTTSVPSPRIAT